MAIITTAHKVLAAPYPYPLTQHARKKSNAAYITYFHFYRPQNVSNRFTPLKKGMKEESKKKKGQKDRETGREE